MVRLALPASLVTIARPARPARGLPPPLTDQAESRRRPNWARTTFRSVGLSRRTSRVDRGRAASWFRVSRSASLSRAVINLSILNRTPLLLESHGYDRSLLKIASIPKGGNVAIGDFDQCRTIPSTGVDGVSVLRQPARLPRSNSHGSLPGFDGTRYGRFSEVVRPVLLGGRSFQRFALVAMVVALHARLNGNLGQSGYCSLRFDMTGMLAGGGGLIFSPLGSLGRQD